MGWKINRMNVKRWKAALFALALVPPIQFTPATVDFGTIDPFGGPVSASVSVKNVSDVPLTLTRVSTSCGCTTAQVELGEIASQEERAMQVEFDPAAHPDVRGGITRVVYLNTSDPDFPEVELDVVGTVEEWKVATVFFNEACSDCGELVEEHFPRIFGDFGYRLDLRDYINDRSHRRTLSQMNEAWGVPFELQAHIETFVGDKLLIGGHVPEEVIRTLLAQPEAYDKLLVYQDEMHGDAKEYRVWDFQGEVKTYAIDEPIERYFEEEAGGVGQGTVDEKRGFWSMFALVSGSAFLDGINPCAFAVLLFFIAFLFTLKRTRAKIWQMGLVYIGAIYLAYVLIGFGIAQAIVISGAPHLMAKIGAYLVIALGAIQLIGIILPSFPIRLRIPLDTKAVLEHWLYRATLPSAFIGGFLVGLCTFPCSGGIYVAIIGLLSTQATRVGGIAWLLWYNVLFVAPLLILLALSANRRTTEHLQALERVESKRVRVFIGLFMVALGAIILVFFT